MSVNKSQAKKLVGKHVYVMTLDGQLFDGVLEKVSGDKIYLHTNANQVQTSAFSPFFNPVIPLVLFDLLAISEFSFFPPFFI